MRVLSQSELARCTRGESFVRANRLEPGDFRLRRQLERHDQNRFIAIALSDPDLKYCSSSRELFSVCTAM